MCDYGNEDFMLVIRTHEDLFSITTHEDFSQVTTH